MTEIAELQVQYQTGIITINYDELKEALNNKLANYKNVVYTADIVKVGKDDVAELRKLRKALDDKRKEIKKTYNDPYKMFEDKVKELITLIDKPIVEISSQLDSFEEQRKEEKRKKIDEEYQKRFNSELMEYCPLEKIFDEKWVNASTSMKSIKDALDAKKTFLEESIKVICDCGEETEEKALKMFKANLNLQEVLAWINQYRLQKEEILKKQREEEQERQRKEDAERVRKEEQAKQEAEKKEAEAKVKAENEQMAREMVQEKKNNVPSGFGVATSEQCFVSAPSEQTGFNGFSTASEQQQPVQGFGGFNTVSSEQTGFQAQGFGTQQEESQVQGFGGFKQQENSSVIFTVRISKDKAEQFEGLLKVWGYTDFDRRTV